MQQYRSEKAPDLELMSNFGRVLVKVVQKSLIRAQEGDCIEIAIG